MGELLCVGRCQRTYGPNGWMAAKANETACVEAMEDPQEPKAKSTSAWSVRILGETSRRIKSRILADVEISPGTSSAQRCLLATSGPTQLLGAISTSSHLTEPPGADPHARWCGRGAVSRPPIPIIPPPALLLRSAGHRVTERRLAL